MSSSLYSVLQRRCQSQRNRATKTVHTSEFICLLAISPQSRPKTPIQSIALSLVLVSDLPYSAKERTDALTKTWEQHMSAISSTDYSCAGKPLLMCRVSSLFPTYSQWPSDVICRVRHKGIVEIIANNQGHRITPSWVSFGEEERLYVNAHLSAAHCLILCL